MTDAAFIFIAGGADPANRSVVETPSVRLITVGVPTYESGAAVAKELVDAGCAMIELCGGFGIRGTYLVEQAVAGKARVGAVRFDIHPALGGQSGDDLF